MVNFVVKTSDYIASSEAKCLIMGVGEARMGCSNTYSECRFGGIGPHKILLDI